MSFIGEADGPDPHDAARAKAELDGDKPPRLQHRDKVRRKVKMGEKGGDPDEWPEPLRVRQFPQDN